MVVHCGNGFLISAFNPGNGFYIITSASFMSQAICYNHCLLSEKVRAKSYDFGAAGSFLTRRLAWDSPQEN
jgi:hypothetical protein